MKIGAILESVDLGAIALPEFQRGYVWNREQVRNLTYSLYHRHPVGSLLIWVTSSEGANARGDTGLPPGFVKLLLDGQQRITSLYGIIKGRAPKFFDGNVSTFTDLYFSLAEETFEFYSSLKMKDNPLWINVTDLMQQGVGPFIKKLLAIPELQPDIDTCINRLSAIHSIQDIDLHIDEVTGEDKTVDVVVDIFNRVNSGGTKLSKGDLALARICAAWPEARSVMKAQLDKWGKAGFSFKLEWILRIANAILTGEALFSALKDIDTASFQAGLQQAGKAVDKLLNLISGRLGLDHDRVLGSRYSFPVMARYLMQRGWRLSDHRERDKLLYWYVHTFLWGRYAGSTESMLNQDLGLLEQGDGALDRLIGQLRQQRGDLRFRPNDFVGWSKGARFYPLIYMLTRVCRAKDLDSGLDLSGLALGKLSRLQLHHIFPKAKLYQHGYQRSEVNAIANFTFLTQETNLMVTDREPADYLAEFITKQPGAVESHWIPMDRDLWQIENYAQFLKARRELLAQAANEFLESLLAGEVPEAEMVPGGVADEVEESLLRGCNEWIELHDLPRGEYTYELADPDTGEPLALVDLAWPDGLQEGYSQPVALLIDEGQETEQAVNRAGYRYFTDVDAFKAYVLREVVAAE